MAESHRIRRRIRLAEFDYASAGAYFVTVCTWRRECVLGRVCGSGVEWTDIGRIASEEWDALAERDPFVAPGELVVMPNHIHGLVWIQSDERIVGARFIAPTALEMTQDHGLKQHPMSESGGGETTGAMNRAPTLGKVIRAWKARTTYRAHRAGGMPSFAWQRSFHDHVIRNDKDLAEHRQYIQENPVRWVLDPENLAAAK